MRALKGFGWLLAGACVVLSCGSSQADGAASGSKARFVARLCAEYQSCCEGGTQPDDGTTCRAFFDSLASDNGYEQSKVDACLADVRARGSACSTDVLATPHCQPLLGGSPPTRHPGDTCERDGDCIPAADATAKCVYTEEEGEQVQRCQLLVSGVAGDAPCVGTRLVSGVLLGTPDAFSPTGFICEVAGGSRCNGGSGECEALPFAGEKCLAPSPYPCAPDAYCDFGLETCQARVARGAACRSIDECSIGDFCDGDTTSNTGTCAPRRATGAACTGSIQCQSAMCLDGTCARELGAFDLLCEG